MIEHDIEHTDKNPVRLKSYKASSSQTEIFKLEIKLMLDLKIIIKGESDTSDDFNRSPRARALPLLNSLTREEFFPFPNIEEKIEGVAAAMFITA